MRAKKFFTLIYLNLALTTRGRRGKNVGKRIKKGFWRGVKDTVLGVVLCVFAGADAVAGAEELVFNGKVMPEADPSLCGSAEECGPF
jgi:hypothetical protein